MDWFADLVFFSLFFVFSVTSSCSFHVSMSLCVPVLRDDSFSDTLSQKADSEASSGHAGEEKCSGKDLGSPSDIRISEAYITRLVSHGSIAALLDCNISLTITVRDQNEKDGIF